MCLLIVAENCVPDYDVLTAGEWQNPDGMGVAYRKGHSVYFKKGIEFQELMDILHSNKPPFVIHFRAASAGGIHPGLCHPFPVRKSYNLELEGKAEAIIAHNGTLMNWHALAMQTFIKSGEEIADGPWSDTRFMSWLVAHNGPNILGFLGEKVAYMTAQRLRIFNRHNFVEHKQKDGTVLLSYDPLEYFGEQQRYAEWWSQKSTPSEAQTIANAELLTKALRAELDEITIQTIKDRGDAELAAMAAKCDDTRLLTQDARILD